MRHSAGVHLVVPPGGAFRETRRIELGVRVLSIGRGESCDVRIDVPGVDDEHAKISEVALIAVGSDCAVGDVPLDAGQRRLVMAGDELQIGSVVLALDGHDPTSPPAGSPSDSRIRVVEGNNFGDELVLAAENREYVIGRSPTADLVLDDREVSREHIKVVRRGLAVFIYDAASTRGSWLGRSAVYQGARVEWQRPRMLKLGASVLTLDVPRAVALQVSAPMTPPPRIVGALHGGPDTHSSESSKGEAIDGGARDVEPTLPTDSVSVDGTDRPHSTIQGGVVTSRTAWKKTAPTIGRATGLFLLALAAVAILGVLFLVFSLME